MAQVLSRAVRQAARRPVGRLRVTVRGTTVEVQPGDIRRRQDGLRRATRSHNSQRTAAGRALAELVWRRWAAEVGARDWTSRQQNDAREEVEAALPDEAPFARSLDEMWPVLVAREVLDSLRTGALPLADVAGGLLDAGEVELVRRSWLRDGISLHDLALLDELDELVGSAPVPEPELSDDDIFAALHAETYGGNDTEHGGEVTTFADRTRRGRRAVGGDAEHRDYAHIVVDEAQDVTPMQWRMLGRRGRSATWTVVGDWAQSAWAAEAEARTAMTAAFGRRGVREHRLTTNYRTGTEIAALAARVLAAIDPTATAPVAVRTTGVEPVVVVRQQRPGRRRGRRGRPDCWPTSPARSAWSPRGGWWSPCEPLRRTAGCRCSTPGMPRASSSTPAWWSPRRRSSLPARPACASSTWPSPAPRSGWSWSGPPRSRSLTAPTSQGPCRPRRSERSGRPCG